MIIWSPILQLIYIEDNHEKKFLAEFFKNDLKQY